MITSPWKTHVLVQCSRLLMFQQPDGRHEGLELISLVWAQDAKAAENIADLLADWVFAGRPAQGD